MQWLQCEHARRASAPEVADGARVAAAYIADFIATAGR